jgi:hypothetical protein
MDTSDPRGHHPLESVSGTIGFDMTKGYYNN